MIDYIDMHGAIHTVYEIYLIDPETYRIECRDESVEVKTTDVDIEHTLWTTVIRDKR